MAIAVQSSASTNWATASSVVVTKPTGLAVGDLLIAYIPIKEGGGTTVSTPSGWTLVRADSGSIDLKSYVYRKTADSSDVAASNFTFVATGSTRIAGALFRIDGHSSGTPVYTSADGYDENQPTNVVFADGGAVSVTPLTANSVLLFLFASYNASSNTTVSGYAVTTSNPTWTELFDINDSGGAGSSNVLSAAWATRTQTTATTGLACTLANGNANSNSRAALIVISPSKDVSVAETITATEIKTFNVGVVIAEVTSLADTLTSASARLWRTLTKNVSTWNNPDKP